MVLDLPILVAVSLVVLVQASLLAVWLKEVAESVREESCAEGDVVREREGEEEGRVVNKTYGLGTHTLLFRRRCVKRV